MDNNLAELSQWSRSTLDKMKPANRRRLVRKMLILLRAKNVERIKNNISADGDAWEPRKRRRKGQPQKMLRGFAKIKRFKIKPTANGGTAGFGNNLVALIHHAGLRDQIVKGSAATIKYSPRPLLGITPEEEQELLQMLTDEYQ